MRRTIAVIGVALLATTLSGCGGKHGAKVSGRVSIDGAAPPSGSVGTVAFFPSSGGPPATGRIQEDGAYQLSTGRDASLPPGDYNVTVGVNAPPEVDHSPGGGPPPPGKPLTPPHYRQSKSSGLTYTVKSGSNTIDLELSSESS